MLYDPKWEQETKVDPLSVAGLIAWLAKQPTRREYEYYSCQRCLVAEYLKSIGSVNPDAEYIFSEALGAGWPYDKIAAERPHTFGAALERARALTKG